MAGYTRSYNKSTGNTIEAADFNTEFQLIDDAFNASTGHVHDGSTDNGGYVATISDSDNKNSIELDTTNNEIDFNVEVGGTKTRQFVLADGAILPDTDNDVDLGSATFEFKDLHIDGTANIDSLVADAGTIGGVNIVGISTTQTLTNKTIVDTSNTLTITAATVDNVASGNLVATDVQAALNELQGDIDTLTAGGLTEIVQDTTPQLGGTLDLNSNNISTGAATISPTELGYLDGVTSAIQTQLNAKGTMDDVVDDTTPQLGGNLDVNAKTINYGATQVIKIDSTGRILTGSTTTDAVGVNAGSITISTGNSGVTTPATNADDLIIEGSGAAGLTVATPNNVNGSLKFADPESSSSGRIAYNHSTDKMVIETVATVALSMDSTQRVITGDGTSDALGAEAGSVTISTGNSGVSTPLAASDDLVIENDANGGISLLSPNMNSMNIAWGDPQDSDIGKINYSHTTDAMTFTAGAQASFKIEAGAVQIVSPTVPSTSSSTGTAGTISWDTSYFYVCTATNTWKRMALDLTSW